MTTLIVFIILFLFLSAFFSGAEIAFISANKLSVEVEKNKGSRRGRILAQFYDQPKSFLGTMLVGNNIALVVFTTLVTKLLQPYLEPHLGTEWWFLLATTVIVTIVILLFGEFVPKIIFRFFANELITTLIYPLAFFRWLLMLPAWMMTKLSNVILKYILRTDIDKAEDAITRLDLQDFVEGTVMQEQDEIETDMFKNALHLKDVRLEDCMVPRPEIEYIDIGEEVEVLSAKFEETMHSRIIVTDGDIDNVQGYVHHQELLRDPETIRDAQREITFVPETMSAKDLMLQMIFEGNNIACVVDEFGGTAGIITLEDILEEIFGEIEDEHDEEEYIEQRVGENEYLFSGRLEIDYINEKYKDIDLPSGEYNTLSGYIVMTSGKIPEQGEEITMGRYRFILESVSAKKIETIRVLTIPQA